jgi:N-succinyldiaminopimelate aminotransferase
VRALSKRYADLYDLHFDAMTEIGVFSGCTEAIASAMLGMLNPGDEVVLFEPYYDSYPACVVMAGAKARFCTLRAPDFAFDPAAFEALITPRTPARAAQHAAQPHGQGLHEGRAARVR